MESLAKDYGAKAPNRKLPKQNWRAIYVHAQRFLASSRAQRSWAEPARKAVDYYEDRQWDPTDKQKLERERRPVLTINKIKPLVNLVYGYFIGNRIDMSYLPGYDGTGTAEVAQAISAVSKNISQISRLPHVDATVTLDALLTGRGFWDGRLSFERNDLGEMKWRADDPFSTYLDPDAEEYDLNSGNYIMTSRWLSLDEVEYTYGKKALDYVRPLTGTVGWNSVPNLIVSEGEEISPWRRFGGEESGLMGEYQSFANMFYDFIDTQRKQIRMLDIQHYVRTMRHFFIDLETGDRKPVPDNWTPQKIQKVVDLAQQRGQPLVVEERPVRRVRWTQMIGDLVVFDDWSRYDTFTKIGFFPYFRRGKTMGMVESLLSLQDEINKRRSSRLNIINRAASSGWIYPKGSLDPQQKRNLEEFGSSPGVHVEYDSRNNQLQAPQQITGTANPVAQQILEKDADDDIGKVWNVNEAALGQTQTVQSGEAIQNKQRSSVVGMELFQNSFQLSKVLMAEHQLGVVQTHYTERRVIRVIGPGKTQSEIAINNFAAGEIANNITMGKYAVVIDEVPLAKSFLMQQFDELMRMKELGMPIPDDLLIDFSSMPRKEEIKAAMQQQRLLQAGGAPGGPPPPPGGPPNAPPPTGPGTPVPIGNNGAPVGGDEAGRPALPGNVIPMAR